MSKKEIIKELQETGLTRRQLVELIGLERTNSFLDWMRGQTVAILGGFDVYYYSDIQRFLGLEDKK